MSSVANDLDVFELNDRQISTLIEFANFTHRDVFFDIGSGKGRVVRRVAERTSAKKSIGIESVFRQYDKGRKAAIRSLTRARSLKTDFWYGDMDFRRDNTSKNFYDLSEATVAYYSLHEDANLIRFFQRCFGKRHLRIITKDLPLLGYRSVANRDNDDCWFFLTRWPLSRHSRIGSKNEWAQSVLGVRDVTMEHVYSYYAGQISGRSSYSRKGVIETLLELEILASKRF